MTMNHENSCTICTNSSVRSNNSADNEICEINVDKLLESEVGACGLWQWLIALIITLSSTAQTTFPVFANSASSYRCRMENEIEQYILKKNLSFSKVSIITGSQSNPSIQSNTHIENSYKSGCYRFHLNWSQSVFENVLFNESVVQNNSTIKFEPCPYGYIYEENPFYYPGNVVKEFGTVCQYSWFVPLGTSFYVFGMLLGFILGGLSGDRFGRKFTVVGFGIVELTSGLGITLSPTYTCYVISRAICAIGTSGKYNAGNVLLAELTLAKHRSTFNAFHYVGINLFHRGLMALWAYFVPKWYWLNLAVISPVCICFPFVGFLPESPRWLVARENYHVAIETLKRGYRINHFLVKKADSEILRKLGEKFCHTGKITTTNDGKLKSEVLISLFKPFSITIIRKRILLSTFILVAIVMSYFGLMIYARLVHNYVYIIAFLNSLMSIPSVIISTLFYRFTRLRKQPLILVILMCSVLLGTSSIYTFVAKPETDIILTVFSNISFIFCSSALCMCSVYVPELFPSEIRTHGFGIVFGLSRLGSMFSSFINELDQVIGHGVPLIIYSLTLILSLVCLMNLPNTSGENLADKLKKRSESRC